MSDFVDDVIYSPRAESPSFWVTETGRRQVTIDATTFRKSRAGQILVGSHELEHAIHFDEVLKYFGGDLDRARRGFFMGRDTQRYAIREILTEGTAIERTASHLGGISPQLQAESVKYISFFMRRARIE